MMTWKTYIVSELENSNLLKVEDGNHGEYRPRSHEFEKQGTPFIRSANIDNNRILFESAEKINKVALNRIRKGIGKPGDVLFSSKGTIGKIAIAPVDCSNFVCSPQVTFWRSLDLNFLDRWFLYYFIQSHCFYQQVNARCRETDMAPYISLTNQREFEVPVPDIKEQRNIAAVLSCLDRQIENLRRQNETLEAIAQTLFKHWFVDFEFPNAHGKPYKSSGGAMEPSELGEIPAGWRVGKLGDIATFKNGKSPPEKSEDFKIPIYGSNGVIGYAKVANNHKTVIIGRVGSYCGSLFYYIDQCWVTDNAMTGSLKNYASHAYLYFFLASSRLNKLSGGSGQPLLNQTILSSIELSLPDKKLIQKFEDLVNPLFRKIFLNQNNVETLTKTRDVLLPKLMSGKLRIT